MVGLYDPISAPWLPPGDCPQKGRKPCSCWYASITEAAPTQARSYAPVAEPVEVVEVKDIQPRSQKKGDPNFLIRWIARVLVFLRF